MTHRQQLHRLDSALLDLIDERARLRAAGAPPPAPDDLLRRYRGDLPAEAVLRVLAVIDEACAPTQPGDGGAPG